MMRAIPGLAWLTYRNLFAGKRAWAAGLLILLPPLVATAIAVLEPEKTDATRLFHEIAFHYSLRFMIFLLSLIFGIAITSGEIEEGTAVYVYLGAVPKWLIVLVQVAVAALSLALLAATSLLLTAMGAGLGAKGPIADLGKTVAMSSLIGAVGILVSLAFYVTCGLVFRRPLVVSVVATMLWEILMTPMPMKFAAWTVTNNLRALFRALVLDGQSGFLYRYVRNFELHGYGQAAFFLSILTALFLVAAMVAIMNRSIEGKEAR